MIHKKIALTAAAFLLAFAGAATILQRTAARGQDKIEYNQVYDCGDGKEKFKV